MIYRMELTYDETVDNIDNKFFPSKRIGYSLLFEIYQMFDLSRIRIFIN